MIEVVALFRERDTRDELGLGSIRDAFAELFFPGTSTLQTRARYFLFVPWLYRHFETHRQAKTQVEQRLHWDENQLIKTLKDAGEEGVIGQRSGASLQRYPSSIYWNGLRRWGILRYTGSQSQYHRWLDSALFAPLYADVEGEAAAGWENPNWDPALPEGAPDLKLTATFTLSPAEAAYLRDRLQIFCPGSLLKTLVERCAPVGDVTFIWEHPQLGEFSTAQQQAIRHAQVFSTLMQGASLLYNLMLADLVTNTDLVTTYQDDLLQWREGLASLSPWLPHWDQQAFWQLVHANGRIPTLTEQFVRRWLDLCISAGSPPDVATDATARALVREREIRLKRSRSRFESLRHRELWSGAAGIAPLDFRWRIAQRLTNDILYGLPR